MSLRLLAASTTFCGLVFGAAVKNLGGQVSCDLLYGGRATGPDQDSRVGENLRRNSSFCRACFCFEASLPIFLENGRA